MTKYVLDTNLYVRAFRSRAAAAGLEHFYAALTPNTYLHSVVLHELLAGADTPSKAGEIRKQIAGPLLRIGRLITPSHRAWERSGEALATLSREQGLELRRVPRSFVNDLLLAASCREAGVTLVTENERDFDRIRKVMAFSFVPPWPT